MKRMLCYWTAHPCLPRRRLRPRAPRGGRGTPTGQALVTCDQNPADFLPGKSDVTSLPPLVDCGGGSIETAAGPANSRCSQTRIRLHETKTVTYTGQQESNLRPHAGVTTWRLFRNCAVRLTGSGWLHLHGQIATVPVFPIATDRSAQQQLSCSDGPALLLGNSG